MLIKHTDMNTSLQECPLTAVMTKQACPNGGYCMYLSQSAGSAAGIGYLKPMLDLQLLSDGSNKLQNLVLL